jgi:hypothetical protein
VPFSALLAAPFSIPYGLELQVRVFAYNSYGDSDSSQIAGNVVLVTYPDPPVNVRENPAFRGPTTIYLEWDHGPSDGGSPITEYDLYYDQGVLDYIFVATTEFN